MPRMRGTRILMYHAVGTPALGDSLGLYSITPERFAQHVQALAGKVTALKQAARSSEALALTFDDGYMDNLQVAAPLLVEHGIPFTVFVTAGFVQKSRAGFLTPAALRELAALPGASIGAHGYSHLALTGCNAAELRHELRASRHCLEDLIGKTVDTMAYPYGAANQRVRDAAAESGYVLATSSHAGVNPPERDRLLLCRTDIHGHDSVRVLRAKLRGDWDWYRFRRPDPALA